MGAIVNAVVDALLWLINICYAVCKNYWIAILAFTFLTKVILLPLSVWVQKNSIKTVRMQPEMNHIKAAYCGNQEMISEEQYKLFKREKYSPFADLIPLFVQLALLMGVVEAVKRGTPLTTVPVEAMGVSLVVPLAAALSAFFMCYVQNRSNVLQAEQGETQQVRHHGIFRGTVPVSGIFCIGGRWLLLDLQQRAFRFAAFASECVDQS